MCVCVCVCVKERGREREFVCVCACMRVCVCKCMIVLCVRLGRGVAYNYYACMNKSVTNILHDSQLKFDRPIPEDAASDPFLLSVLQHVLKMDWSNHSKFSALTSLARCVGAQPILLRHPHFPTTLLTQMADQSVACHVSEGSSVPFQL